MLKNDFSSSSKKKKKVTLFYLNLVVKIKKKKSDFPAALSCLHILVLHGCCLIKNKIFRRSHISWEGKNIWGCLHYYKYRFITLLLFYIWCFRNSSLFSVISFQIFIKKEQKTYFSFWSSVAIAVLKRKNILFN